MSLPLEGVDYFIYYMRMPPKIYAFVMLNSDGTFSIFLDPNRSHEQQLNDYEHELWHIIHDDFYNGLPIQKVENL